MYVYSASIIAVMKDDFVFFLSGKYFFNALVSI